MDLNVAISKAAQILGEERRSPTVHYEPTSETTPAAPIAVQFLTALGAVQASQELVQLRLRRPRKVLEDPSKFSFRSVNYDLLCALMAQVRKETAPQFVRGVLHGIVNGPGCGPGGQAVFPSWDGMVSEFPLVAEFVIRNGGKEDLFVELSRAQALPGHVMLLRHLEEMIALNYAAFSDAEYERLSAAVKNLSASTKDGVDKLRKEGHHGAVNLVWPGLQPVNVFSQASEIISSSDAIIEQCRNARYLYLKSSLLEGLNLEVNQDKAVVQTYIQQFGYPPLLIGALDEADRLYYQSASGFDLKSSMGHMRSFVENLQAEAVRGLVAKGAVAPSPGWGAGLVFLRQNGVLTQKEEALAAALYGLISDQAVHPLIAEQEYARLARNMVIEFALLLFRKLDKLGLKAG